MDYIIIYKSVSTINRIKKMLKKTCRLKTVQLPSNLGIKGCHYGLFVSGNDFHKVIDASKENGIEIKYIFTKTPSGYERYGGSL